jgi:predicted AAA+ superfamily ATPase
VESVPAWIPQRRPLHELAHAGKHHLTDPALAARLLNVDTSALLGGHPSEEPAPRDGTLLGQLFESLVTLCIRVHAQAAGGRVGHLRQHRGRREIDLIVQGDDQRVVALEVKLAATVDSGDVKHLLWLREHLGEDLADAVVVTTGAYAYHRRDGVAVVPAALLGP